LGIISVDVTDGQSTDLVNASPYLLSGLTWSPDETTLVFTAGLMLDAANDLYLLDVESTSDQEP